MKRFKMLIGAGVVLLGTVGVAQAVTIDYVKTIVGNQFTSSFAGAEVETFDAASLLWGWSGDGGVVSGSVSGKYAAPAFSTTIPDASKYVTVPLADLAVPNTYTANVDDNYTYFGLWWGSVDNYNTLAFYNGNTLVGTYTGTSITAPNAANGNQVAPSTNLYVNFYNLTPFNKVKMTSTNYAFEADNLAVGGKVPEPSTLLLLGAGLLGLAGVRRRKAKK